MKKTIIGSVLLLSGLLTDLAIIIAAAIYSQTLTSWSGSRFWYAIFGGRQYGRETVDSMFLGIPFLVGLLVVVIGLIILGMEYYQEHTRHG